ncbi:RNA polymerase sigma factor [Mangrovicoccus sp. HB161399]|uniref:RNA polymerase sigma factor n=1 Tax=Mangrovicoccus sp. HB161399 TaxID=2720392 RepID=UPI0015552A10|nr:sigma-70 family RNA polymerase sigma factor [Mangrovicoccus sp. HB161399]
MVAEEGEAGDRQLLERIAAGDMAAMRLIYTRHADAARRFVMSRLRDPSEAADIVHNTMIDVWRNAGQFQGRASARSWILTIARNKTVDHIRRQARTDLAPPDDSVADEGPDPETVIAASQDAARVRDCVAKLGDRHRAAIHLAYFEEMTCAEIARVENVAEGTVKTRLFHAKKLLMRCLSR